MSANAQDFQQEYSKSTFGSEGSELGEFILPSNITIIDGCCLFVADYVKKFDEVSTRIQSFDLEGEFSRHVIDTTRKIGGIAAGSNDYSDIRDDQVAGYLYITFPSNDVIRRSCQTCLELEGMDNTVPKLTTLKVKLSEKEKNIVKLIKDPVLKEKIIEKLIKKSQLMEPTKIASDLAGNVYVVDSGNNEIRKYTGKGNLSWSSFVPSRIADITVDPGGENVYVSDNHHVIAFDSEQGIMIEPDSEQGIEDDRVDMIINDLSLNIDAITASDSYFYALDTSKEIVRQYDTIRCYVEKECIKDIHYNDIEGVTIGNPIIIEGNTVVKPDIAAASLLSDSGERIYITDSINHRVVIITEDKP